MPLGIYDRLLELAREQLEAAQRGDFGLAIDLVAERERLLHAAPSPRAADRETVEAVLRIDGDLQTAFRERMDTIREELVRGQRARVALHGYQPRMRHSAMTLDAAR